MKDKIAGVNAIMEALRGQRKVHKIFILEGRGGKRLDELESLAQKKGIYIQYVDKSFLDNIYKVSNHQGVIAQVEEYEYSSIEDILVHAKKKNEDPFILILDGLEDPHNMGAVIRTAECAGVHGIIIPKHNTVEMTETVARVSAGALEHILIVKETNLVRSIEELKKHGLWIIAADMDAGQDYFKTNMTGPIALVIGKEGSGIRRLVKEKCDIIAGIPLKGKVESLNASVASALLMYEVIRQRELT